MSLEAQYRPFVLSRPVRGVRATTEPQDKTIGGYAGFIQPVGGGEQQFANGLKEGYSARLYCDLTVPVQYGDKVTQDGITWRVVSATEPAGISAVFHHKEVLLGHL